MGGRERNYEREKTTSETPLLVWQLLQNLALFSDLQPPSLAVAALVSQQWCCLSRERAYLASRITEAFGESSNRAPKALLHPLSVSPL